MASEDDSSLSEEDLDEIAERVAEMLADDPTDDDTTSGATGASEQPQASHSPDSEAPTRDEAVERAHEAAEQARARADDRAREARERAKRKAATAREESDHRRGDPFEDLGERIERSVEASLHGLADDFERAFGPGGSSGGSSGVTMGPEQTREKAVYKTQLQKGGRVAVPDAEIEALGLEPGDTLQVVLYPVE